MRPRQTKPRTPRKPTGALFSAYATAPWLVPPLTRHPAPLCETVESRASHFHPEAFAGKVN